MLAALKAETWGEKVAPADLERSGPRRAIESSSQMTQLQTYSAT